MKGVVDGTHGLNGSGVDGGLFYIGTDGAIHEVLPLFGNAVLAYGADTGCLNPPNCFEYSPMPNLVTGFYDGGIGPYGNLHVFYIDTSGWVDELYEPASVIGSGSGFGSWTFHHISATPNAAH